MADLIDRLSGESEPSRPKINVHRFVNLWWLYALGEWTANQIATEFDLQGSEATQAASLAAEINGYSTDTEKWLYIARANAVFMCIEDGDDQFYHSGGAVNKSKVYEDLLLT